MGSRYGRNKKRAALTRIEELSSQVSKVKWSERSLQASLDNARVDAFREFVDHKGLLETITRSMAARLGAELGKEMEPYVKELVEAWKNAPRRPMAFDFNAPFDSKEMVRVLRIRIPELHMNYAVSDLDWVMSRSRRA